MTNKETIERNIGLTFDFLRQLVKNPSLLNKIPNQAVLEFIEKDFAKKELLIDQLTHFYKGKKVKAIRKTK